MTRLSTIRIRWTAAITLLTTLAAAHAQPEQEAIDPAAVAALERMAERLASLRALRVEAEVEYDAVQRDGQSIEFGSTREVAVRRPDRLRASPPTAPAPSAASSTMADT
jgi:hypothetical protein